MKRYIPVGLLLLSTLALTSCATNRTPGMKMDLTQETWMREVNTNPNVWTRGADQWFLSGKPNSIEMGSRNAPYTAAISTTTINVPNFTRIQVKGDFEVQIFGTYGSNSVYIYGPNDDVRAVAVDVKGDLLCVNQARKASGNIRKVIVRIGVNQLHSLTQLGGGLIEGIQLQSNDLTINASGSGNVYLAGNMNVRSIVKTGSGCVSVFGANTPVLDIKAAGSGALNVSGNVGVRSILKNGRSDVNIIGANSDNLKINAKGHGKIGISGIVNLRELTAKDFTRVYVNKITSSDLYAYAYGQSHIGLAGNAQTIYVDAFRSSCVGAKNVCAVAAYARAHDSSHINIGGSGKIFAAATENGSVYFFGTPAVMSQFVSGNGTVIPIWNAGPAHCAIAESRPVARPYSYKVDRPSYKGESNTGYSYSQWKQKQIRKHQQKQMAGEG